MPENDNDNPSLMGARASEMLVHEDGTITYIGGQPYGFGERPHHPTRYPTRLDAEEDLALTLSIRLRGREEAMRLHNLFRL